MYKLNRSWNLLFNSTESLSSKEDSSKLGIDDLSNRLTII